MKQLLELAATDAADPLGARRSSPFLYRGGQSLTLRQALSEAKGWPAPRKEALNQSDHSQAPGDPPDRPATSATYAFPSPERQGHLVLAMNVMPLAVRCDLLRPIVCRFPAAAADHRGRPTGVCLRPEESELVFSWHLRGAAPDADGARWSRKACAPRRLARRPGSACTTSAAGRGGGLESTRPALGPVLHRPAGYWSR